MNKKENKKIASMINELTILTKDSDTTSPENIKKVDELKRLMWDKLRYEELVDVSRKIFYTNIMLLISLLALGSKLTINFIGNGNLLAFITSIIGTLGVTTGLTISAHKWKNTLSTNKNDLKDISISLLRAKTRYIDFKHSKSNVNTLSNDKEVSKDLEQIFNEVRDEEYTLEEKPKVRTRK